MISYSSNQNSVFRDIYNLSNFYQDKARQRLISSTKDSLDFVQRLDLECSLNVHNGCVNTVCWNETGEYVLSGSDDQNIIISDPFTQKVLYKYKTAHRANIFSARFMPKSNERIVSCSGDGTVLYTELTSLQKNEPQLNYFNCHNNGTTYEVMTLETEPQSFLSCGEDGTVRLFDLRQASSCHKTCCKDNILIFSPSAITAMTLSPNSQCYIAIGSSDSLIRVYDRRYLSLIDFSATAAPTERYSKPVKAFTIPTNAKRTFRVTSVQYSSDECDMLVSYSSDYLYLLDVTKPGIDLTNYRTEQKRKPTKKSFLDSSPPPVRKLRLRGDWSDTGPNARPEGDLGQGRVEIGQVRPQLHGTIMHRMTEVLSRMLNDPQIRSGLSTPNLFQDNQVLFANAAREIENYGNDEPQPGPSGLNNITTDTNSASNNSDNSDEDDDCSISNDKGNEPDDTVTIKEELEKMEMQAKQIVYDYLKMKYKGHRNCRTMIKEATFWGEEYVMSGSDCGYVFIWERKTGNLVKLLQADQHVVNCLQPHPILPMLATSGIDYNIKIWSPIRDQPHFDIKEACDLMARNAVMLEETKGNFYSTSVDRYMRTLCSHCYDTITVPAAFMIRMLACIHSLRNRNRNDSNHSSNNSRSNTDSNNDNNRV